MFDRVLNLFVPPEIKTMIEVQIQGTKTILKTKNFNFQDNRNLFRIFWILELWVFRIALVSWIWTLVNAQTEWTDCWMNLNLITNVSLAYLDMFFTLILGTIYLFRVNNGYTRTKCEIRLKLTIKTPKRR